MRRTLRRALERGLVHSGLASLRSKSLHPTAVILAYHNIVPGGEAAVGEGSLHLDQAEFGRQLDLVAETHEIVTLEAAFDQTTRGTTPRAVITFDDAYVGAVTAGFEEVTKRGLPATMFVPPGMLDDEGYWWDRLSDAGASLDQTVRNRCLVELRGRQADILAWATRAGVRLGSMPAHARPADEATLMRAARAPGIALGAHTWSHPNLGALELVEARAEIARSRAWLRERTDAVVDWVAYPYGIGQAGLLGPDMRGGLRIDGGQAVRRGRERRPADDTPRVNVPRGMSLDGLRLRLAGVRD